ncbi:MAG: hypothetical protein LC135_01955 [Phycisphaerae bacterium]|nr:hypothetical protein [Phycisphaerae bacterium]MCZ2398618.1 hypothetical protein [Phycisphaerae bacterium]
MTTSNVQTPPALNPHHAALRDEVVTELLARAVARDLGGKERPYLLVYVDELRRGVTLAIHDWAAQRTPASETLPLLGDHLRRCRDHVAAMREAGHTAMAHVWQRLLDDLLHLVSTGRSTTPLARAVEDVELGAAGGQATTGQANGFAAHVAAELASAAALHPPLHSPHEALAVIDEELSELRDEVYRRHANRNYARMLRELIQVAAMCQRAAEDLGLLRVADQLGRLGDTPSRLRDRGTVDQVTTAVAAASRTPP